MDRLIGAIQQGVDMTKPGKAADVDDLLRDPAALKAHFKKFQAGLSREKQNWAIRVHRAISWYEKAMLIAAAPELIKDLVEARLLFLWISLSALFSRWDPEEHRPAAESTALKDFVDELILMDQERRIIDCLGQSKATVRRLIANPFLHMEFWLNPFSDALPGKLERGEQYFGSPLTRERAAVILGDVLYRIFMLRGQIVHGASTSGSKLNRQTISDCVQFLQRFVPVSVDGAMSRRSSSPPVSRSSCLTIFSQELCCGPSSAWAIVCATHVGNTAAERLRQSSSRPSVSGWD